MDAIVREKLDQLKEQLVEATRHFFFAEFDDAVVIKRELDALAHILQPYVDSGVITSFVIRPFKPTENYVPGKFGEWSAEVWLKFPPREFIELNITIATTGAVFVE